MQTETISVPEIHCDHCKSAIEGALHRMDGVTSAVVDVPRATVEVAFDEGAVSRPDLVRAIEDQGYEVPAQP